MLGPIDKDEFGAALYLVTERPRPGERLKWISEDELRPEYLMFFRLHKAGYSIYTPIEGFHIYKVPRRKS